MKVYCFNIADFDKTENSFIIFHDNGYTLHEPRECLTQRHVTPDFGNFYFIPDELDAPPSLCEKGFPCIWGGAVNVKDVFVYATQPRENRIVVIDVANSYNPNQVTVIVVLLFSCFAYIRNRRKLKRHLQDFVISMIFIFRINYSFENKLDSVKFCLQYFKFKID